MDEGFDGEFDEEKGFADEIVAAGHHGTGAIVKIAQGGDKNDGGFLVLRQGAELGAEFIAGHAGHVHIEEDEVEIIFREQLERNNGVFQVDGVKVRFVEGIDDGATRNGFVIHDKDIDGGNFLFLGRDAVFKQKREKVNRCGNRPHCRSGNALGFFVDFAKQGFESASHTGNMSKPGQAGIARERVNAAVKFVDVLQSRRLVIRLNDSGQTGAKGGERGGQAFNESFPQFSLKRRVGFVPGGGGQFGGRAWRLRDRAAVADGGAHDVEHVLGGAIGLGKAFGCARARRLLNHVSQVNVGEDNQRQRGKFRNGADLLDDFHAGDFGQHEIEQHHVGAETADEFDTFFTFIRGFNLIAFHG